jgi:lysophospholipase L1-like esterase
MKKIIYSIIIFFFVFCCIELFCRCFCIGKPVSDERNSIYQYDSYLGWFPIPDVSAIVSDSESSREYKHNSLGFRDIEHNYKEKTKKRIMFLGDSFCYGYGISQKYIFTELLIDKLEEYELFNCGISGYGTDQEYLLLVKYIDIIKPDIVILLLCDNDVKDNVYNNAYYGYYKPYFILKNNKLILNGIPVPKSWLYYKNNFFVKHSFFINYMVKTFICLKNPCVITNHFSIMGNILNEIVSILNIHNSKLIFSIAKDTSSHEFKEILKNNNCPFIDLENDNVRSEYDFHWNEKGHQFVADKIYDFFKEEKYK